MNVIQHTRELPDGTKTTIKQHKRQKTYFVIWHPATKSAEVLPFRSLDKHWSKYRTELDEANFTVLANGQIVGAWTTIGDGNQVTNYVAEKNNIMGLHKGLTSDQCEELK